MTTYCSSTVKCAVCGKSSEHPEIMSTNEFGAPDLDLRPAPMKRDTMNTWVKECPHCGYVGSDLSAECKLSTEKMTELYNEVEVMHEWPSKPGISARKFAKLGNILATTGKHQDAAWQFLCAAWAFDDLGDQVKASIWRTRAIDQIDICLDKGFAENLFCMRVDMLRRTGKMKEVLEIVPPGGLLSKNALAVIEYQKSLAATNSTGTKTLKDVPWPAS